MIKNFLNPEGHQNQISGSKVTVIVLKGLIFPIGGASAGEGLHSRLVSLWPGLLILAAVKPSWQPGLPPQ